jgi:hypothetical protein
MQYIYSSIEDSEVVLVFERNDAGLKKLVEFSLLKCHVFLCTQLLTVFVIFRSELTDICINSNRISEGLLCATNGLIILFQNMLEINEIHE